MSKIDEIALRVAKEMHKLIHAGTKLFTHPTPVITSEQKPFLWHYTVNGTWDCYEKEIPPDDVYDEGSLYPLFTTPPNTADIEQRVAEAFLKALNGKLAHTFGHDCAEELKSKWREYL